MKTEFFLAMKPPRITHQQKKVMVRNGKPVFYETPELQDARSKLMAHLGKQVPDEKYTNPIRVNVKWCFPLASGKYNGQYKDTKPDVDNSQKLLLDCMTKSGFWKDDAQVVSLIAEKFWADIPGIYIQITEV